MKNKAITKRQLLEAIHKLPEDEPINNPRVWYRTQKEHWIGWLNGYEGKGAYSRKKWKERDARFVYNHIVNYQMLTYLAWAAGVDEQLIFQAKKEMEEKSTMMAKSGVFRRHVSWEIIAEHLWRR